MIRYVWVLLLLAAFPGLAQVPGYVPADSLKAWYPFTGNTNDLSGNAKNGINQGALLTTDRYANANSAYTFDGSSYIDVPDGGDSILDLTGSFSLSVWIYMDTLVAPPVGHTILGKHIGNIPMDGGYILVLQGSNVNGNWYNCQATPHFDLTTYPDTCNFPNHTWLFFTMTYNKAIHKLIYYTNAVATDTISVSFDVIDLATDFLIGASYVNTTATIGYYYTGKLDDIGIWKRALSVCEIKKLYLARTSLILTGPVNDTVSMAGTAVFSITDTTGSATYQWQENTGAGFNNLSNVAPYSGTTTKILSVAPATAAMSNYQYRCIRMDAGSCADTSSAARLVIAPTSLNTLSRQQISISPNPLKDYLSVIAPVDLEKIEITDMLGRTIISRPVTGNAVSLDLKELLPGIYIIKLNGLYISKFVKE